MNDTPYDWSVCDQENNTLDYVGEVSINEKTQDMLVYIQSTTYMPNKGEPIYFYAGTLNYACEVHEVRPTDREGVIEVSGKIVTGTKVTSKPLDPI